MFDMLAFDADDTLWHSEALYTGVQERFRELLGRYVSQASVDEKLYETEMRNLRTFGYGIKGFTLSMIETAIELTNGQIVGSDIQQVIDMARGMVHAEVRLLDHVEPTLAELSRTHSLMIITKGDLLDQESKIARSGLAHYFAHVEIVSDKTPEVYAALFGRLRQAPERLLMVGNSLRSDILPVIALGATAVHIPYAITWAHEAVHAAPKGPKGYHELASMGGLAELVRQLERGQ